jgi:hypothetical protein
MVLSKIPLASQRKGLDKNGTRGKELRAREKKNVFCGSARRRARANKCLFDSCTKRGECFFDDFRWENRFIGSGEACEEKTSPALWSNTPHIINKYGERARRIIRFER